MDAPSPDAFNAVRSTIKERKAAGKALRRSVPRASHAEYAGASDRGDPVETLIAQAATRVPKLVPIRHARMLSSPFGYFRGNAAIMARDLQFTPVIGLTAQLCGDAHVANFGVFASAERRLVFGINDFDETIRGPWEWDLKRLIASIVPCCRFLGADREVAEGAIRAAVKSYRRHMFEYAELGYLSLWYEMIDERKLLAALPPAVRRSAERNVLAKARQRTNLQVLDKMTELVDDRHRIIEVKPLVVRETHGDQGIPIRTALGQFMTAFMGSLSRDRRDLLSNYRIVDVVRKVVGVGSVGTRCWVILLEGASQDDALFLQAKEAQHSALAPYVQAPAFDNQGHRVVRGQRRIQGAPDILLGWGKVGEVDFYVRQLRDMKGSVEFDPDDWSEERLDAYAMVCGWALALAHAKSGDAAMIAGYVGRSEALDDALVDFALAYGSQVEQDYDALQKAAKAGRIKAARVF